jgi:hypothetical protein
MFPIQNSVNLITRMQSEFTSLQKQLATGQKASNLAELGDDRFFDLSIRARQSRIEGYGANITMVNTRLDLFNQVITRLGNIQTSARTVMQPSTYGSEQIVLGAVPTQARSYLDEVTNLLNSDVNGRFLFAGGVTDKQPVASIGAMIDGANGKAGFAQVANERLQADQGGGMGRLTLGGAGDTTTLAEDGAHPFGFKLSTLTASSSAVTLTGPTGPAPQSLQVQFTGVPATGDSVTIGLTLPDGTSDGITLKAVTGTPGAGEFQIGSNATITGDNFRAALQTALQHKNDTVLAAASNNAAAENFFNASGTQVQRVQGPTFATATTLVNADPTNTVIWYTGGDSASPRSSIQARVDDLQTVNYGAQANESGTLNLVRSLAVMSIQNFVAGAPETAGKFDAIASRNIERLSALKDSNPGSIAMVSIEMNNAKVQVGDIKSRHTAYSAQLDNMLADIETVPDEQVAMQITALQTRLTATYQTTTMLSQLSLVNFLK